VVEVAISTELPSTNQYSKNSAEHNENIAKKKEKKIHGDNLIRLPTPPHPLSREKIRLILI